MCDREGFHGASDPDIEQAAFLVHRAFAFRALVGKDAILRTNEKNMRKLEALRGVHGDKSESLCVFFFILLALAVERKLVEKITNVAAFAILVFGEGVEDFFHPAFAVERFFGRFAGALEVIHIPGIIDESRNDAADVGSGREEVDARRGEFVSEFADRGGRFARDFDGKIGRGESLEKALVRDGALVERKLDCRGSDAAGRCVDDAEKRDVIIGIDKACHHREDVLDFPTIEKTFAADEAIGNAHPAEIFLQQARLRIHAINDSKVFPRDLIRGTERTYFIDDEFRFDLIIRHTDDMDRFAAFLRTPEVFSTAAGVVFDEAIRGREDRIRAAVILLETDDLGIGKVFFKLQNVRHLGPAPSVDALVVIAHHANIRR